MKRTQGMLLLSSNSHCCLTRFIIAPGLQHPDCLLDGISGLMACILGAQFGEAHHEV